MANLGGQRVEVGKPPSVQIGCLKVENYTIVAVCSYDTSVEASPKACQIVSQSTPDEHSITSEVKGGTSLCPTDRDPLIR